MATDGKRLVNALYHSAVVSGHAIGYTRLGKMVIGGLAWRACVVLLAGWASAWIRPRGSSGGSP